MAVRLGVMVGIVAALAAGPASGPAAAEAGPRAAEAAPATAAALEWEIRGFETADRTLTSRPPRTVFIGSSTIRLWEGLAADFPNDTVVNRGFGGSHIADSVYFADRILAAHKPTVIVMYAGSNDINAGKSATTVASDFKAFTAKAWSSFPHTAIAYISIAPTPSRWSQVASVREANRLIAAYCATDSRLTFIDVFPLMLGPDGKPRNELFREDGLHMNRRGYQLWLPPVRAYLRNVNQRAAKAP
jgi:lysophospholipase L1-like esterase